MELTKSEKLRAIRRLKTSPPLSPLAKNRESAGLSFSLLASSPFLSETAEREHARECTRVSFRVLLSHDFSRLPETESLLAAG